MLVMSLQEGRGKGLISESAHPQTHTHTNLGAQNTIVLDAFFFSGDNLMY